MTRVLRSLNLLSLSGFDRNPTPTPRRADLFELSGADRSPPLLPQFWEHFQDSVNHILRTIEAVIRTYISCMGFVYNVLYVCMLQTENLPSSYIVQ